MHQLKRALISLSFMLAFMIVLEIVRMGLANDSKTGTNTIKVYPAPVSAVADESYLTKKYLIVYDANEKHSAYAKDNYAGLLQYLKIDYDLKDVKEYTGDYKGYDCVLITTADWGLIKDLPSLVNPSPTFGHLIFFENATIGFSDSLCYNNYALLICRIGQRWRATRAAYEVCGEGDADSVVFFFRHIAFLGNKSDKLRGFGGRAPELLCVQFII
jgi:hypothetical protein